jgi:sulfonate transport system substrate-binding protein
MTIFSRRFILASALLVGLLPATPLFAADKPTAINIDWATYNPVAMVLKQEGLLEKEFAKDGITVRWVQTLGSNKALEFLNAGSIDFGRRAGGPRVDAGIQGDALNARVVSTVE